MRSLFIFLLFSYGVSAQSYSYTLKSFNNGLPGPMNGVPGDLFMTTVTFSNSGSVPIQIFMDRYQKNIAPYWAVCYCYIQCHSPADDTVTVDVQPFSTTDISLQFKNDSVNPGISTASFRIYQKGFSAVTQTIHMTGSTMGPVGLGEIGEGGNPELFPNPVSGNVWVRHPAGILSVTIRDIAGNIRYSKQVNDPQVELNISDYSPGIYFMEVHTNVSLSVQKLVKE